MIIKISLFFLGRGNIFFTAKKYIGFFFALFKFEIVLSVEQSLQRVQRTIIFLTL